MNCINFLGRGNLPHNPTPRRPRRLYAAYGGTFSYPVPIVTILRNDEMTTALIMVVEKITDRVDRLSEFPSKIAENGSVFPSRVHDFTLSTPTIITYNDNNYITRMLFKNNCCL